MSVEARPIRFSPTIKLITVALLGALFFWLIRGLGNVLVPFVAAAITAYLFNLALHDSSAFNAPTFNFITCNLTTLHVSQSPSVRYNRRTGYLRIFTHRRYA
jgi:uncharacterized membrane protein YjjP (DUF1212 family)